MDDSWCEWELFINFILENHEWASLVLIDAGLINIQKGVITLALPAQGFAMSQIRWDRHLLKKLSQISTDYFDEDMEIRIIDDQPSLPHAPSFSMVKERYFSDAMIQSIEDAKNDMTISSLIMTFNAEIKDVHTIFNED